MLYFYSYLIPAGKSRDTGRLVHDANDALSRIKVSGATPAAECSHVEGTTRGAPLLLDEHSSDFPFSIC